MVKVMVKVMLDLGPAMATREAAAVARDMEGKTTRREGVLTRGFLEVNGDALDTLVQLAVYMCYD